MAARKAAAARPAVPAAMPAEERLAKLERVVRNRTREARAEVETRGEFSAVLRGGELVQHRLHLIGTLAGTAAGAALGRFLFGEAGLPIGVVLGAGYGLFWGMLALTGGLWRDHLAVDEQGVVTSDLSGRPPGTRSNFLKVAIPVTLIAYCLFLVAGLSHDIAFPPEPRCNVTPATEEACLLLPNLADALGWAASPSASPSPSAGASASASPSPSAVPSPSAGPAATAEPAPPATNGKALSKAGAAALERVVRGFQLFFATIVLLVSVWFLRRMLTGQWVVAIAPVRRLDDG